MTDLDDSNLGASPPKWYHTNNVKEDSDEQLPLLNNNNNNNDKNHNNNLCSPKGSNKRKNHQMKDRLASARKKPRLESLESPESPFEDCSSSETDGNGKIRRERPQSNPTEEGTKRTSLSPSTPPKSPGFHNTRTSFVARTSPQSVFASPNRRHSPYDRFSPATFGGTNGLPGVAAPMKQMEGGLVTPNCSDLIRSLAAKYNNSNDYFASPVSNGFLRPPIPALNPLKMGPTPFLGLGASTGVTMPSKQDKRKEFAMTSLPTTSLPLGVPAHGISPPELSCSSVPGYPGLSLIDMNSTQALFHMVRNASMSQHSHQQPPQLENYLKESVKRVSADAPSSPLDLSSSVSVKSPGMTFGRSFDMKDISHEEGNRTGDKTSPQGQSQELSLHSGCSPDLTSRAGRSVTGVSTSYGDCNALEEVLRWTVEEVCNFVRRVDLCSEYAEAFREQRIDGYSLPLLTERHLTSSIHMKLGPALKLRSVLARKMGSLGACLTCVHCRAPPMDRHHNWTGR